VKKPTAEIVQTGNMAGVFVSNDKGSIGICAQSGQAPYVIFWGHALPTGNEAPVLAISAEERGGLIQIPGPDGTFFQAQHFSLASLVDAVQKLTGHLPQAPPQQ
jgi:hypothetical protein